MSMIQEITALFSVENSLALLWAGSALALSVLLALLLAQRLKKTMKPGGLGERTAKRGMPLVAPFINILLLMLGAAVLVKMGYKTDMIVTLRPLAIAWFLIALVYAVTASIGKTVFVALLLLPFSLPGVAPYFEDAEKFLTDISFKLGKIEMNAFQVAKMIIAGVLLLWIANAVIRGIALSLSKLHLRASTREVLQNISTVAIYIIAGLIALSILGIDLTAFAVFGGAIGVGIGFGLQKIASNFISGLILLFERSIKENDFVEIEGSNITGLVRHTGARYTMVETLDNRDVMIPNEDFITKRVINWTYSSPRGLLKMSISVTYNNDLEKVRDLLLQAAAEHPRVLKHPAPSCSIKALGPSPIEFFLYVWIADVRDGRATIQSEVLFGIWRKFKENDIEVIANSAAAAAVAAVAAVTASPTAEGDIPHPMKVASPAADQTEKPKK